MYFLYTFTPPMIFEMIAVKYGKTSTADGRLGKYQLPYGPLWQASYSWLVGHPDPKIIDWLEESVGGHFRNHKWGIGPGMTEWLTDITWEQVAEHVEKMNKDLNLGLTIYGPGPWTPQRIMDECQ